MPITFIDIERQKSWRIAVLFIFLLFLYFCISFALAQGLSFLFPIRFLRTGSLWLGSDPECLLTLIAFSLLTAGLHFWLSASGAVSSVTETLGAVLPDREDGVHRMLQNIMDEIHIATGNRKRMRCMVVPSLSMNALAVTDLRGDAVIAITEGLLSRLTRPQLEAVMAHEAYHVLSGDCLETTVAASLFGIHASALEGIGGLGDHNYSWLHPVFWLYWALLKFSTLLSMFISREREYRADAAALRMTRNPLAMAEALSLLSRNWTGSGLIGSGIEMLCIVNPLEAGLDESEGLWADLMSTHPPLRKRIEALLKMARVSISDFEARAAAKPVPVTAADTPQQSYHALTASPFLCPSCKRQLVVVSYEKTTVHQCAFCGGTLVGNDKIPRILVRRGWDCTERVKTLAKAVVADNQRMLMVRKLKDKAERQGPLLHCPKCGNPMLRTFYSLAYLVEIDRCGLCGLTWFDVDELEMLQCLIENRITVRATLGIDE